MDRIEELCKLGLEAINNESENYNIDRLKEKLDLIIRPGMDYYDIRESLIQISLELTTDIEPKWQYVASNLYVYKLYDTVRKNRKLDNNENLYSNLYGFIESLTEQKLYGKYILENYSREEIEELEKELKPERDFLFTYSGIKLLSERYLVEDFKR